MTVKRFKTLPLAAVQQVYDLITRGTNTFQSLDSRAQTFAAQAAAATSATLTARVAAAELAANDATQTALAVTVAGENRVATVAALNPAAADGSSAYVEGDGLVYQKQNGVWLPRLDLSAAKYGSAFGGSLYTLAVTDTAAKINPRMFRAAHRAITEGRPLRIGLAGDSITEGGDTSPYAPDRWADRLIAALRAAMPDVQIEAFNFGLGGRTLAQMVDPNYKSTAAEPQSIGEGFSRPFWPGWVTGKAWRDFIRDWNADVLVIAHGMNDSGRGFAGTKKFKDDLNAFLTDMQGWPSAPDPVLVSGFESTNRADSFVNPPKYVRAYARTVRNVANKRGVALMDAHRLDRILRAGVDDAVTAARPLMRWEGIEDQSEWLWDATRWTLARTGTGATEPSSLIPSSTDTDFRAVLTRRQTAAGYLQMDVTCPVASALGWVEVQYRPDEDTGLTMILTPNGSSNGPSRADFILRATGEVLASIPANINAGQAVTLRWTWANGKHSVGLDGQGSAEFEALHATWDGAVRISSPGAPFRTAEYRNMQLYLWEPVGTGRTSAVVREQEVMGEWPIRWPATHGNGMNHVDNIGGWVIYAAAGMGVIGALATLKSLPLERRVALPLLNGWANFDGPGGYPDAEVVRVGSQVRLCGLVSVPAGTTYPVTVAQLPAGFRPAGGLFRTWTANGVGKDLSGDTAPDDLSIAFGSVNPDGTVVIMSGPGEGGFLDLSSCAPLDVI